MPPKLPILFLAEASSATVPLCCLRPKSILAYTTQSEYSLHVMPQTNCARVLAAAQLWNAADLNEPNASARANGPLKRKSKW